MNPNFADPPPTRNFPAVRNRLLIGHIVLALLILGISGASLYRLMGFPPDPLGAAALAGLAAGLLLLPALIYRIYLLATAGYAISAGGAIVLRLGSRKEVLPAGIVEEIRSGGSISATIRAAGPGWLDTWQGWVEPEGEDRVDWIATDRGQHLILLATKHTIFAISPADPVSFVQALTDLSARGSLEKIELESVYPAPILLDILRNRAAFTILTTGLLGSISLGAFLMCVQPYLRPDQPFNFDPHGNPASPGDPSRLLLLPLTGGIVWLMNSGIGWLVWRKNHRPAGYTLWVVSMLVSIGLWISVAILLNAK
jgi:Bacterial PH domain